MENNILKLMSNNGEVEIEVLDIINNEENGKEYMVYRFKGKDDVLTSIVNYSEDSYSLDTIEDPNEFKEIEDYLAYKANGEKIARSQARASKIKLSSFSFDNQTTRLKYIISDNPTVEILKVIKPSPIHL